VSCSDDLLEKALEESCHPGAWGILEDPSWVDTRTVAHYTRYLLAHIFTALLMPFIGRQCIDSSAHTWAKRVKIYIDVQTCAFIACSWTYILLTTSFLRVPNQHVLAKSPSSKDLFWQVNISQKVRKSLILMTNIHWIVYSVCFDFFFLFLLLSSRHMCSS
jgi:hypothetical protein